MCVRWGERARASELERKGGKVEVGGRGVLTLFVRHVCVAIYGLKGGVYHTLTIHSIRCLFKNIITVSSRVHGIMALTSACRDWTWNCSG
jgi:hypothetical protein